MEGLIWFPILGQGVLPSLEISLVTLIKLINVRVGHKFAELKVVVVVCCFQLISVGLMCRQVKVKVFGVVTESEF